MKLNPKSLLVAMVFVVLFLGYYYYLTNRGGGGAQDQSELTDVERVLTDNLEMNYPPTPREVLKLYTEIQKCYYNEEFDGEELLGLAEKARALMDPGLLELNPEDLYLQNLQLDIADWHRDGKTMNVLLPDTDEIIMSRVEGRRTAWGTVTYLIREGASVNTIKQTFILRKDEDRHWKIYSWFLKEEE